MNPMRCHTLALLACSVALSLVTPSSAQSSVVDGVRALTDIPYKSGTALSAYEQERCKLDVYLPTAGKGFATLVWFHGGGLKNGDKDGRQIASDSVKTATIARSLAASGIAVATPNYRLSPKAKFPAYIQDAAAAAAWAHSHIAEHGGDVRRIFIGGHSAGGYLALMLGLDAHYLADAGVKLADIAGFIPVSGQVMTHYTVLEERGLGKFSVMADDAAPVHFSATKSPPFLILYADHDMAARAEENVYLISVMKAAGNKSVAGMLMADRTHGTIASKLAESGDPGRVAILNFISANSLKP